MAQTRAHQSPMMTKGRITNDKSQHEQLKKTLAESGEDEATGRNMTEILQRVTTIESLVVTEVEDLRDVTSSITNKGSGYPQAVRRSLAIKAKEKSLRKQG